MDCSRISLLAVLLIIAMSACKNSVQQPANLSPAEFEKAIKQPGIQLLDVRTSEEYQTGHLADAFLADWNNKTQFTERVKGLDKSKPVYTYCLSGARSASAMVWLNENGYTAFNLDGGIAAWKQVGKSIEADVIVKQIPIHVYEESIADDKTVLVDIGAVWCPPCKKMSPIIDSLATLKQLEFELIKIDGGEQSELCQELNVDAFPTFIVYKSGKEVWRKSGILEPSELVQQLK